MSGKRFSELGLELEMSRKGFIRVVSEIGFSKICLRLKISGKGFPK
jgi:hypothetical protein